jgi:hypothetical protein
MELNSAAKLGLAIELLFVILAIAVIVRRVRGSSAGSNASVIDRMFPRIIARLVSTEIDIWVSLWRFTFSSRNSYQFYPAKRSILGYLAIFTFFTAPIELVLVHVLVPSEMMAWIITGISVYGMFWILGMYASIRTMPLSLDENELILRYGVFGEVTVSKSNIDSIDVKTAKLAGASDGYRSAAGESGQIEGWFLSAGQTDVTICLGAPIRPFGFIRISPPVSTINIAVDKPEQFVYSVREQLNASDSD